MKRLSSERCKEKISNPGLFFRLHRTEKACKVLVKKLLRLNELGAGCALLVANKLTMGNVLRKDSEGTGISKYLTLGTWLKG